jgi:acylphosphatase
MRALVSGRVQGVGFRYFVQSRAQWHGLRGFVRNLADGRVEVEAVGPVESLEVFLGELQQGPPASQVLDCQVSWGEDPGHYAHFAIG